MANYESEYDRGQREGGAGKEWDGTDASDKSEDYNKGYNHGKGQHDGNKNEHSSYRSGNEQYEKGWDDGYKNR